MSQLRFGLLTLAIVLTGQVETKAGLTFNVTYEDLEANGGAGNGVGFDDPTLGAARRATVAAVFDYIEATLDVSTGAMSTLTYNFELSETDGGGPLASAGTSYSVTTSSYQPGVLFQNAETGGSPSGDMGFARFDFGRNWNNGLGAPAASQFDLFTVVLHEVTHSLGFASLSRFVDPTPLLPTRVTNSSEVHSKFHQIRIRIRILGHSRYSTVT